MDNIIKVHKKFLTYRCSLLYIRCFSKNIKSFGGALRLSQKINKT